VTPAAHDAPAWLADDSRHVWHPYASAVTPAPVLPVVGARGTRLLLADGRELVDGMSSWWAAVHGYRHPVLDAALHEQIGRFSHVMFGGLTHQPAVELCRLLVEVTPEPLQRVFLSDSGSVGVEVAAKLALQYWQGRGRPERNRLLTIRGGYHGDTVGAMSVCDPVTGMHQLFRGYVPQQLFVDRPRTPFAEPFDPTDLEQLRAALAADGERIAAVIVEPVVQGAGGMWFYSPAYLAGLRQLCDDHGVLLIHDEVATGFGRTGRWLAAEHAGVVPDILVLGKALTGGYLSLAATLCTDEVAAGVSAAPGGAFMHGPTFMGNALASSVALASVRLLLDGDWQSDLRRLEAGLTAGLAPARALPGVADVRVLGGIGVIELTEPVDMAVVQPAVVRRGAWVRPFGRLVYAMPPYVSTEEDLATVTAAMVAAVREQVGVPA
jgi:adenosylmethionine-8-amino-7-oxononanoate aminotransferase